MTLRLLQVFVHSVIRMYVCFAIRHPGTRLYDVPLCKQVFSEHNVHKRYWLRCTLNNTVPGH